MTKTAELKSLTFQLGGQDLVLSMDEATALYRKLDELFGHPRAGREGIVWAATEPPSYELTTTEGK